MDNFDLLKNKVKDSYERALEPKHLLLGLSGGADSVSLVKLLIELQKSKEFELTCVHVNHSLRKAAVEDEGYVIRFCEILKLPLIVKHICISAKGNLEANARESRYKGFYEAKEESQANCLVLAHHMDDQTETVIMRLIHGSGPTGLCAMREYTNGIWRPLLSTRRFELIGYLNSQSTAWREDESNIDLRFLRNSIRYKLLPVLEDLSSSSISNIAKTSRILSDEEDYWSAYSQSWLSEHASLDTANTFLNLPDFVTLHIAVKRRVLRSLCAVVNVFPDMAQLENLIGLADGPSHKTINLPLCVQALKSDERLHLISPKRSPFILGSLSETDDAKLGNRYIETFDAEFLENTTLRYRMPGDRIKPLGANGSQSLKKYLIDHHMDRPFRDHWPLLTRGEEVLWVIGFGMAQTAAISENTKTICTLVYRGNLPDETEIEKKGQPLQ